MTCRPGSALVLRRREAEGKRAHDSMGRNAEPLAPKAGTDHVVRCVVNKFGQFGVRANSISPGITRTPMSGDALNIPEILQAFEACYPRGRIGTVDDVAEAALWWQATPAS